MTKPQATKSSRQHTPLRFVAQLVLVSLLVLIFAYWAFEPAGRAIIASYSLDKVFGSADFSDGNAEALGVRRRIQKHYLQYDIYMPLEDIIVPADPAATSDKNRLTFLMRNVCGSAKIYVWVPIKIRVPGLGNMIWEWCWKPKLKDH